MTGFTKEELYKICAIVTSYFCDPIISKADNDLINKIESMIDNYCEHQPHGDFHVCVDKCKKCGVICQ